VSEHVDHVLVTVEVEMPMTPGRLRTIEVPWNELHAKLEAIRAVEGVELGAERLVIGLAVEMHPHAEDDRFL
jgi:hypothetical protein